MSYYRYITGIYKSYWPELNRTLRSSSSPRHIPEPVPCTAISQAQSVSVSPRPVSDRIGRATSLPPAEFYSNSYFAGRVTARPFNERSLSMPRQLTYSYDDKCVVTPARETSVERCIFIMKYDIKMILYTEGLPTRILTTRWSTTWENSPWRTRSKAPSPGPVLRGEMTHPPCLP